MNQQEEFEFVKERMLKSYADYMEQVIKISFDDLHDVNTRVRLIDAYTKSVLSNIAYRNFINEHNELNKRPH